MPSLHQQMLSDARKGAFSHVFAAVPGYSLSERMGARPTLEVNGITGGFAGPGFKTVIPHRAHANISCRLVPDQDPAQIVAAVREHIQALTLATVMSEVMELEPGAPGFMLDPETPVMQAAITANTQAWGKVPILSRKGGSVPVVAAFQDKFKLPVVLMPYGYKGGGAHGPDEYLPLNLLHRGISTTLYFYAALAAQGAKG